MRIINRANEIAKRIVETIYVVNKANRPKIASCCLTYRCSANEILVYNTLTKELVLLSKEEYLTAFSDRNSKIYNELLSKHMIDSFLDDIFDVTQSIRKIISSFDRENTINSFVILTTTTCNARCFYCFQKSLTALSMDRKTALAVSEYIKGNFCGEAVNLRWFGGEPLCNIDAIRIICERLVECKIPFESKIVTNGFLFDKDTVEEAKSKWNLKSAQITFDGTEKVYNRVKNYVYNTGTSPYYTVINNISYLLGSGIKVAIRLNLDRYNETDLYLFIDEIAATYCGYKGLSIYVHLLFDDTSLVQSDRSEREKFELCVKQQKMEEYIKEKGLYRARKLTRNFKATKCAASNVHSVVVFPNGEMGCCDMRIGEDILGSVFNSNIDNSIRKKYYVLQDKIDLCSRCNYAPACFRAKRCSELSRKCESGDRLIIRNKLINNIKKTFEYSSGETDVN